MVVPESVLAHAGGPLQPHDVLGAWSFDPAVVVSLVVVGWLYWRGWHPVRDGTGHGAAMLAGLIVLAVALLSPIDAVGAILLSGHMVQHVLLVAVAAPLIAWAAPAGALIRGTPAIARRRLVRARRRSGLTLSSLRGLRHPLGRWLLLVVTLWVWHSAALYSLAIENTMVHIVEHGAFVAAAIAFWNVIVGPMRVAVSPGLAILAVFTLTLQGIVLSMLMTFSPVVWYAPYADGAPGWDIDPLADQQLAGVIMWVPTGFIQAGITFALLARWLHSIDGISPPATRRASRRGDQDVAQFGEPPATESEPRPFAALFAVDQAGLDEQGEVVAHRRLGALDQRGEVTRADFAVGSAGDDRNEP